MTLDILLERAWAEGLIQYRVGRMTKAGWWQASSLWTWSGGYHVEIEQDPMEALRKTLAFRPASYVASASPVPVAVGEAESIFD